MKTRWIALLLVCVLLSGCAAETLDTDTGITFTDAMGRTVTVSNPQRVGVCSGSLAECWLLAGGKLCAVTRDAVTDRQLDLPQNYIDLGSLKEPSLEAILAANLDFVILMEGLPNHRAMAETLEKTGIAYAYFDVENFSDYLDLMKIFTDITGRPDLFEANATSLQSRIQAAIANGKREDAPKVLILRTSSTRAKVLDSSFMVGGMLKEFGCVNIADNDNNLLSELSLEAIAKEDPDYIFISCMGDWAEGQAQLEATLISNPIWNTLQAVQNGRVFYLEKELFHNKPNTRWGESYEILADLLSK